MGNVRIMRERWTIGDRERGCVVCVVVELCTYHICWVNEGIQIQYFGESHSVCVCVCVCAYV